MLKSLDLFTGIGGMTLALKDIAHPVAYCEVAKDPINCLLKNMKSGYLPEAPINKDIRTLNSEWLHSNNIKKRDIQMITGGFPCQGISLAGKHSGFDHEQSKLFYELLRVADLLKCPLLFLENVSYIISLGMTTIVSELCHKRGYELRWIVISAESVGALHVRKRWFCLAIKPSFTFTATKTAHYKPFDWSTKKAPARATLNPHPDNVNRLRMLGNSLVPDVARRAFIILLNKFENANISMYNMMKGYSISRAIKHASNAKHEQNHYPTIGISLAGSHEIINLKHKVDFNTHIDLHLILNPKLFKSTKPKAYSLTNPILKTPMMIRIWATPRAQMTNSCNYLTTRAVMDLPNQIRFEESTPNHLRAGKTNADFVEWLMGYLSGWTKKNNVVFH